MDADIPRAQAKPVTAEDYEALAAFRRALRRFLAFSEDAARARGLTAPASSGDSGDQRPSWRRPDLGGRPGRPFAGPP